MRTVYLILAGLAALGYRAVASGGGDGVPFMGGDIVYERLELARLFLLESVESILQGNHVSALCQDPLLSRYSEKQRIACREFIVETSLQYDEILRKPFTELFGISRSPIWVEDSLGNRLPVSAKTEKGPSGKILFHYDAVHNHSVLDWIELLGHEVGHKVRYEGTFIDDNSPAILFENPGGSREFLNLVGMGLRTIVFRFHPYFNSTERTRAATKLERKATAFLPEILSARNYRIQWIARSHPATEIFEALDIQDAHPPIGAFLLCAIPQPHVYQVVAKNTETKRIFLKRLSPNPGTTEGNCDVVEKVVGPIEEVSAKRNRLGPTISIVHQNYNESGIDTVRGTFVDVGLDVLVQLGSRWFIESQALISVLLFTQDPYRNLLFSVKLFRELSLGRLVVMASGLGWRYLSMMTPENRFGFTNLTGPELLFNVGIPGILEIGFAFVPYVGPNFFSLSDREWRSSLHWKSTRWSVGVFYRNIHLGSGALIADSDVFGVSTTRFF